MRSRTAVLCPSGYRMVFVLSSAEAARKVRTWRTPTSLVVRQIHRAASKDKRASAAKKESSRVAAKIEKAEIKAENATIPLKK